MDSGSVVDSLFLVFVGAAVLATAALVARQAMLVAYIVLGAILGPWGTGLVNDAGWIEDVSKIGIMFLLYLLGLNMLARQLWRMLAEALEVTIVSSVVFTAAAWATARLFGFGAYEALLIGGSMMFSSTIIGLKLLPTTTLHHQHTGQVIVSVLLLQDLLAILVLLVLGYDRGGGLWLGAARQILALPVLLAVAYGLERWLMEPLMRRFDQIHEYLFLLVIAWCLAIAQFASFLGLSHEIGAFIAGVALAACPASMFIADSLRPLRDFFLILFFFALGARFDALMLGDVMAPALALAAVMLVLKPVIFRALLVRAGEARRLSLEIGMRLGQVSEFSLLIAVLAHRGGHLSGQGAYVIQVTTLLTFIISSYLIVMRYPTPIAVRDSLRRD